MNHEIDRNRAALVAVFLSAIVAPATCQTDGGAPEAVAGTVAAELSEARLLELPPAKALDAIAAATATDQGLLQRCSLYSARRADDAGVMIARVPVTGEDAVAVIALGDDMSFIAAAITDINDGVIDEWRHFIEDLEFHDVPRLEGALPRSQLAEQRERALARKDDADARLTIALLDVLKHMNEQASVFNLPRDRNRDQEAEWRMASREYTALAALAEPLKPILSESAGEFARLAASSAEAAGKIADATLDRDRHAVRLHKRVVTRNCKKCHNLPTVGGGKLQELSTATRHRLGIGDGFYQFGHDLRIRHPDRVRAQHVADALRVGALLIDARRAAAK